MINVPGFRKIHIDRSIGTKNKLLIIHGYELGKSMTLNITNDGNQQLKEGHLRNDSQPFVGTTGKIIDPD